jgi:glutathione S-transferase
MFESGAIVDYVLARADSVLRPRPQDADFAEYLMWSHAGEATLTAPLAVIARHAMILPPERRAPLAVADAHERWTQYAGALADRLAGRDFIAGPRFTGADIMVGYALHLAGVLAVLGAAPARVHAYWRRLSERPAYGRAAAA